MSCCHRRRPLGCWYSSQCWSTNGRAVLHALLSKSRMLSMGLDWDKKSMLPQKRDRVDKKANKRNNFWSGNSIKSTFQQWNRSYTAPAIVCTLTQSPPTHRITHIESNSFKWKLYTSKLWRCSWFELVVLRSTKVRRAATHWVSHPMASLCTCERRCARGVVRCWRLPQTKFSTSKLCQLSRLGTVGVCRWVQHCWSNTIRDNESLCSSRLPEAISYRNEKVHWSNRQSWSANLCIPA